MRLVFLLLTMVCDAQLDRAQTYYANVYRANLATGTEGALQREEDLAWHEMTAWEQATMVIAARSSWEMRGDGACYCWENRLWFTWR